MKSNDRRGLGSIGPFDLASGESFEFDFAYPWARAYDGDPWSSALLLKERAAYIRDLFENNNELFQEVREPQTISISLKVYPNPASDKIKVEITGISGLYDITVFDAVGQPVLHEYKVSLDQVNLNIQNLEKGFYMMRIKTEDSLNSARFIKN
ncbi:MAG: T9SS type A sorting domain-containing protein [Bacteroidales bacterium]